MIRRMVTVLMREVLMAQPGGSESARTTVSVWCVSVLCVLCVGVVTQLTEFLNNSTQCVSNYHHIPSSGCSTWTRERERESKQNGRQNSLV